MNEIARTMAGRLRDAFDSGDLSRLEPLLQPGVRWGGEGGGERSCRTSGQVLQWYRALQASGVRAQVTEALALADAVVVGLELTASGPGPRGGLPDRVWQVFRLDGGRVADIGGSTERDRALELAATPLPVRGRGAGAAGPEPGPGRPTSLAP